MKERKRTQLDFNEIVLKFKRHKDCEKHQWLGKEVEGGSSQSIQKIILYQMIMRWSLGNELMNRPYSGQVCSLSKHQTVAQTGCVKSFLPTLMGLDMTVSSLSFPGLLRKLFLLYRFCGQMEVSSLQGS